jgi:RNA polymerase sigma-70 factor (ECF subfamily)
MSRSRGLQLIFGGRSNSPSSEINRAQGQRAEDSDQPLSLRRLYHQHGGTVYGRCLYLLKEPARAEDAMQDVFAKALTHATQFRSEASPVHWLMKIATNHCLNLLRSERAAWQQVFRAEEWSRARQAEDAGGPRLFENREAVRRLLERVDPETQAIAIHYHVDEMTLEEIAALLGRSVPTVRKRLDAFSRAGLAEGSGAGA